MRFIVGRLTDEDLEHLKQDQCVITKLLILPEDYAAFHYKVGDEIEAETPEGNRIWTVIRHLERVENEDSVIVILTLVRALPNSH